VPESDGRPESSQKRIGSPFDTTFPNHHLRPTSHPESASVAAIPPDIAVDLGVPKIDVRRGPLSTRTGVSMPKAPVHKDHYAETRQHDIGLADKGLYVKSITEARGKQFFADVDLR
jgi:hypothetical protein